MPPLEGNLFTGLAWGCRHDTVTAALVTAHCAIGERRFTDFLSFINTAQGWRIIAKVFHYDLVPDPSPDNASRE